MQMVYIFLPPLTVWENTEDSALPSSSDGFERDWNFYDLKHITQQFCGAHQFSIWHIIPNSKVPISESFAQCDRVPVCDLCAGKCWSAPVPDGERSHTADCQRTCGLRDRESSVHTQWGLATVAGSGLQLAGTQTWHTCTRETFSSHKGIFAVVAKRAVEVKSIVLM